MIDTPNRDNAERTAVEQKDRRSDIDQWQRRLLPFMIAVLIAVAFFFFFVTLWQIFYLQSQMFDDTSKLYLTVEPTQTINPSVLEAYLIDRRYDQARIFLASKIWITYMGFITGMILAVVGAAFVIGKLQTDRSTVEGGVHEVWWSFNSTSPGLILAALGTLVVSTSLIVNHKISVRDEAVFVNRSLSAEGNNLSDDSASQTTSEGTQTVAEEPEPQEPQSSLESAGVEASTQDRELEIPRVMPASGFGIQ